MSQIFQYRSLVLFKLCANPRPEVCLYYITSALKDGLGAMIGAIIRIARDRETATVLVPTD